jgi:hypothetical protein
MRLEPRAPYSSVSTTTVMREMPGRLGVADRQRLDVEGAAPEQRGDAVQDAGLVVDLDRKCISMSGLSKCSSVI